MAPVRHLIQGVSAPCGVDEGLRHLLFLLDDWLEQVTEFGNARENLLRIENEKVRIAGLQAFLHLRPRDRGGYRRSRASAKRVDVDRGLVLIVLAPVDEHPACTQLL